MTAAPTFRSYPFDFDASRRVEVTVWPDRDAAGDRKVAIRWLPAAPDKLFGVDADQLRKLLCAARAAYEDSLRERA
jgi:hypothetical protein